MGDKKSNEVIKTTTIETSMTKAIRKALILINKQLQFIDKLTCDVQPINNRNIDYLESQNYEKQTWLKLKKILELEYENDTQTQTHQEIDNE